MDDAPDPDANPPDGAVALQRLASAWREAVATERGLVVLLIEAGPPRRAAAGPDPPPGAPPGLARAIATHLRPTDGLYRLGRGRFLVLCPDTSLEEGFRLAEGVRRGLTGLGGRGPASRVGIGLAARERGMAGAEVLLAAAEHALFAARRAGGEQVCLMRHGKLRCGGW